MVLAYPAGRHASFLRAAQAPPTGEDPDKWSTTEWDGGWWQRPEIVAPAAFHGVDTPAVADFKPPVWIPPQHTGGGTSEMI